MDAREIRRMKPELSRYLNRFADCFARKDTRAHLPVYVEGQLSDLPRKSAEPIALAAGVPVRTLQEFLSQLRWDEDAVRTRLQNLVASEHASPHSIGIIDETSDVKKGTKTPGVQRQWCGCSGKTENCIVTVHLAYAVDDFHCLLDGELFLPESWSEDRPRCQEAGIPDELVYRPKWEIALEQYDRAITNGIEFDWLTFDEGYGSKGPFLKSLSERSQKYVAEVSVSMTGWLTPPKVTSQRSQRRGRPARVPRLTKDSSRPQRIDELLIQHPMLRDQAWKKYRIKDGAKGPMVWEVKHAMLIRPTKQGLPDEQVHLLVARNVLDETEVKFFLSNAPEKTPVTTLLMVAFSRWRVERCFQDQKQDIGLDAWEGRRYLGLKRHLILSSISYLFLVRMRTKLREKKSRTDDLSVA
ncbi:hypothetical protein Pan153_53650 [Gimesia panareensis]|uniref:Transposase IS701-like DDE domain-containing protein n=1 Tax=Gimesia panareensis TaxID=2527978 RepID=A0A518FJV6_9PLAN|nr:IS701 family transposase [Gimesia panareensis]QDV15504.1 hypothetical protein Pan153_01180 [Gimesia panareensis]QDV16644.1 hypothetical protein Pan153_12750 [Gimesia panareensis]QDV16732.1 hypothetical protein Pan153_13640 [Gimesia panareensis]QDV17290.1 hypothetical protein Pan153_19250 [Gimesia panareensis]QDV17588.1 hypothetical protein Pan153_22410 [Gimesia panareensis]